MSDFYQRQLIRLDFDQKKTVKIWLLTKKLRRFDYGLTKKRFDYGDWWGNVQLAIDITTERTND